MFAPITTVIDNVVGNVDSFTVIAAQAVNKDLLPAAMAEITAILRQTHSLGPGDPPDFIVFNAAALLAAGKAAAKQFQLLLGRGGRHLAAHRRHRRHEHHAGDRHRADPGDRHPQGARRPTRPTSSPSSWPRQCCWPASAG